MNEQDPDYDWQAFHKIVGISLGGIRARLDVVGKALGNKEPAVAMVACEGIDHGMKLVKRLIESAYMDDLAMAIATDENFAVVMHKYEEALANAGDTELAYEAIEILAEMGIDVDASLEANPDGEVVVAREGSRLQTFLEGLQGDE